MKKYIMLICLILSFITLTGCLGNQGPSEKVEALLNKYIKQDHDIILELESYIDEQDLNTDQKLRYMNIIKDEYKNIKYEIVDEDIKGDAATVDAKITVKDLYKSNAIAEDYLLDNPVDFYTDGLYDASKFVDYKLNVMESNADTVDYTVVFNLTKEDNKWVLEEMNEETLEKIHGIYNYES